MTVWTVCVSFAHPGNEENLHFCPLLGDNGMSWQICDILC